LVNRLTRVVHKPHVYGPEEKRWLTDAAHAQV
jgi:hypothetical protein